MAAAADLDRVAEQTRTYLDEANGVRHARARHDRTNQRAATPHLPDLWNVRGRLRPRRLQRRRFWEPGPFHNLQADPSVGAQLGTRRFSARVCPASPIEREALWPQMVRIFWLYEEHADKTEGQILV